MMFNNYSYNDLLLINNENFINNLNEEFYLIKSLNIIQARPSVQLLIGVLLNIDFLDIEKLPIF